MFKTPSIGIKKKSGKMKGYPPETPEFGQVRHKTGNPSMRDAVGAIKKPK